MSLKTALRMISALVFVAGISQIGSGAPIPPDQLIVTAIMDIGADLGANSTFNPRSFDGKNYVVQVINMGFARYPAGSGTKEAIAIFSAAEVQMVAPFRGDYASQYVLAAGGTSNDFFSRFNYDTLSATTRVYDNHTANQAVSFDWIDNTTIIYASSKSGRRTTLYKATVATDPFTVDTTETMPTPATVRIRNVRVGDLYNRYAYFGDASATSAGFWAMNLDNGTCTHLGTVSVGGGGSWGLWTVKEVGGYLYVHTTDNGIWIYAMTDATTCNPSPYTQYTKEKLDNLTGLPGQQYWGFDVVDGGARMLLSAGAGRVIEIGRLTATLNGTVNLLDYSGPVTGVSAAVSLIQDGSTVRTDNVTLDGNGGFSITGVSPGTYDVQVKPSHWLAGLTTGVVVSGTADMGTVAVTNGDCDGDNAITALDLFIVLDAMDAIDGDPTWDARADLDGDGVVTSVDMAIVLAGLNVPMISGTVQLADYLPASTGMLVILEFRQAGLPVLTTTASLDADGKFFVENTLDPGTYDVAVQGAHWLRAVIPGVVIGTASVDVGTAALTNGDADGDNEVTSTDASIVLAALDSSNPLADPQADLNGDSQVTAADLAIVLAAMDLLGD